VRSWVLAQTRRSQDAPLRIVTIGGGSGLSTLLHGLKSFVPWIEVTAVVTVTDDGGSSGRLRREFDVLPPGDIRNCMVALSEDETLLSRLFQYRFPAGRGLKGHSFGNLFLTALSDLTGDFAKAVQLSSEVLAIRGNIFPSTAANVSLRARLVDGQTVAGETRISRSRVRIKRIEMTPRRAKPLSQTLEAIGQADLISFGPGSLYTSLVPNVLVSGIPKAIRASGATTVCFVNLMWQPGETMNYTASDHVRAINDHAGMKLIDTVVVNLASISARFRTMYAAQRVQPVDNDLDRLHAMGLRVVSEDLLGKSDKVRHDPAAIAGIVVRLATEHRGRTTEIKAVRGTKNRLIPSRT
jgi:uncharacterized cofD-like protein